MKSPPANSGGVGSIPGPGDSMCCRVTRPMATNVGPALPRAPAPWWGGSYSEKHVVGGPVCLSQRKAHTAMKTLHSQK